MAMVMCLFFNIIAKIHRKFGCFHKKEASLKMILRQRAFCGILEKLLGPDKKHELHRLLGTLLSKKLSQNEKLNIIEKEYC